MWLGSLVGMSRVMFWVDAGFGQGVCFRRRGGCGWLGLC